MSQTTRKKIDTKTLKGLCKTSKKLASTHFYRYPTSSPHSLSKFIFDRRFFLFSFIQHGHCY